MYTEHNITNIESLYSDAWKLLNDIMITKIDEGILSSINNCINQITEYWKGKDSYIQINELISIYNSFVDVRNYIGNTAIFLSNLVKYYREAQILNGANLTEFSTLEYTEINKKEKYIDNSDTIFIKNDLNFANRLLNTISSSIDELLHSVNNVSESIFLNWVEGDENRNYAQDLFSNIKKNISNSNERIEKVIENINNAISNYNLSLSKIASIPSLAKMNNEQQSEKANIRTEDVLNHIGKNIENNRMISSNFNNKLIEEIKKDLTNGGIL